MRINLKEKLGIVKTAYEAYFAKQPNPPTLLTKFKRSKTIAWIENVKKAGLREKE